MRTNRFDPFPPYGDGVTTGGGVPLYGDAVTIGGGAPLYGDAVTIVGGLMRDSLPELGEPPAAPNAAVATIASMSAPNDLRTEHRPFSLQRTRAMSNSVPLRRRYVRSTRVRAARYRASDGSLGCWDGCNASRVDLGAG